MLANLSLFGDGRATMSISFFLHRLALPEPQTPIPALFSSSLHQQRPDHLTSVLTRHESEINGMLFSSPPFQSSGFFFPHDWA